MTRPSRLVRAILIPGAMVISALAGGCGNGTHVSGTPSFSVPAANAAGAGNAPATPTGSRMVKLKAFAGTGFTWPKTLVAMPA